MKKIFNYFIAAAVAIATGACSESVNTPSVVGTPADDAATVIKLQDDNYQKIDSLFVLLHDLVLDAKKYEKSVENMQNLFDEILEGKKCIETFIGNVEHAYADSVKLQEFSNILNQKMADRFIDCCDNLPVDSVETEAPAEEAVPATTEVPSEAPSK